jgi:hypothetical protein
MRFFSGLFCGLILFATLKSFGWDYEGHRMVNQVALASLPANFPAFIRTPAAQERVAFLAGEADRWRNTPELRLQHAQEPEHFIDIEELAHCGLTATNLPPFRYDFVSKVAAARLAHPELFPPGRDDPARKYIWVGLLPWALTENYAKLKSAFSYLKTFEENGGTADEILNAQQNILYIMGVMGHYAGDSSQPLHTTIHHHGWIGDNPKKYSVKTSIHGWVDGGYMRKVGINFAEMKPHVRTARAFSVTSPNAASQDVFPVVMKFILDQYKLVEPLYALDRDGHLSDMGEAGSKGRAFITQQLLAGGHFLGDLWVSAWQGAVTDTYLKSQLAKRKLAESTPSPAKP